MKENSETSENAIEVYHRLEEALIKIEKLEELNRKQADLLKSNRDRLIKLYNDLSTTVETKLTEETINQIKETPNGE